MPELPEVETVKETLKSKILGKKIKSINLIYPSVIEFPSPDEFIDKIKDQSIINIERRGKWILFELNNYYLLSHLRMEGKYNIKNRDELYDKHEHIAFEFTDNTDLRYKDTRKFGKMHLLDKEKAFLVKPLSELGLEPWDKKLDFNYLSNKYKNKTTPIKTVILDQSIIVGIGNIYADEILFLSNINPYRKANSLSKEELDSIIRNTKIVLEKAIKMGGTTIRTYTSSEGVHGKFQQSLLVHNMAGKNCVNCGNIIEKVKINGRGTYYCSKCQK